MKALVIYFSLTGRTKMVAEILAAELNNYEVDIEAIAYKGEKKFKFKAEQEKVSGGDLSNFAYNERIFNLSPYDLICIGVPTWGGRPAFIFNAYIEKCNTLEGKAVLVFNTCRIFSGSTIKTMKTEIEKKGGKVINQKTFKALFSMGEKKARAFGKVLNQ
ncbi:MAG TPA: flavodoxin [Candidatus Deferrimicrobium sp.]|nr:flavodoxin [Candidatus Deferrimicrobium sp.]